jgi:Fe-S cluster biogenesis protein NfuA
VVWVGSRVARRDPVVEPEGAGVRVGHRRPASGSVVARLVGGCCDCRARDFSLVSW